MYQLFYLVSALLLGVLLIIASLDSPPVSPIVAGAVLVGASIVTAALGRALQLLGEIRDRLPSGKA